MKTHAFKHKGNDQVSPLTSAFQDLILAMPDLSHRLQDHRAKRHADHGIGRRLGILRLNVKHALRLTDRPKDAPLYGEAQIELGMHLNSFYIHLNGLLDNLAWLLAYELNLLGPVSEDKSSDRRKVGIFNKDFRNALNHPATIALLLQHAQWYSITKNLRDPIAHRVPLYAVPCIMSNEDCEEFGQLHSQEMSALISGNFNQSLEIHRNKFRLGEYHPVFCQEDEGQPVLCPINEQINQDSKVLLQILWHFIEDHQAIQPYARN